MTTATDNTPTPCRIAAIGMFDGVHCGHRAMIADMAAEAASRHLSPIVVTFDRHPLEVIAPDKAPGLLMPADVRIDTLRHCPVDSVEVLRFDRQMQALTAREFMTMLRDRFHVHTIYMGFNHRFGSDRITDIDHYRHIAASLGMDIIRGRETRIDTDCKLSSSHIRRLIAHGHIDAATAALGRPYAISGTIVTGRQIGRTIGFPTANLNPAMPRQLIPAPGVYACCATTPDGTRHRAIVNIGHRPTVAQPDDHRRTIEAHILDYSGNLYDRLLTLEFITRIRSEQHFPTLRDLTARIQTDADITRRHPFPYNL